MHGHGSRLPLSRSIGHKEPKWYACQWELDYLFCMQCVCWLCMCAVLLFTWNLCQSVVYELREWVFTFDLLFCVKSILCRFCDWKHFLYSMWFACGWVRFSLPFWMSDSLERTYHFFIPSPLQFTCVVNSALHRDDVAFDWIEYAGTRQRLRKATRISHKQQSEYMKIECIHFSPIWKSASPARAIISLVLALMLPKCAHIIITIYISVSHQCVVCRKRIFVIRVSSLRLVPQIHSAYVNLDPCKRIHFCILFHRRLGMWGKRKENIGTVSAAAEATLTRVGNAFYGHYYFFLCFLFAFLFCICALYSLVPVSSAYKFPKERIRALTLRKYIFFFSSQVRITAVAAEVRQPYVRVLAERCAHTWQQWFLQKMHALLYSMISSRFTTRGGTMLILDDFYLQFGALKTEKKRNGCVRSWKIAKIGNDFYEKIL